MPKPPLRIAAARGLALAAAVACSTTFPACSIDHAPEGLRATPPGNGPKVVFDLSARPLPDIPAPNDVATFPDPTSRTGRRIAGSLVAPTSMERHARGEIDEMEGWGTFAPIFVRFERTDPAQPAIDLDDVKRRMHDDGYVFDNDAAYVVNLTTGVPLVLDMGHGNFPVAMSDPDKYWTNDPKASSNSLVFETNEEAAGAPFGAYWPALDQDFDGVIDHPNTLGAPPPGGVDGVDNLLTWYERETDTLILRPLLPMEEKTEYAVVLTDRLRGPDGQPVRSPFPFIHHPTQTAGVAKLRAILGDASRANYYGDIAGTGLDHVAFAWTFTTQPVYEDLRLLRDGVWGKGPFARFANDFSTTPTVFREVGLTTDVANQPADWASHPECAPVASKPFILKVNDQTRDTFRQFFTAIGKVRQDQVDLLVDTLSSVDYFVLGTFDAPNLLGDPQSTNPYDHFQVNWKTGEARVFPDKVPFWLAVPKKTAAHGPPFPVSFWRHGTAQSNVEVVLHAGHFARQGVALFGIDAPGHGLVLDKGQKLLAQAFLSTACIAPFLDALTASRAIDLNGDGVPDSGGLLWSAHVAHSRDEIRQGALEAFQGMKVLRSFDGTTSSGTDFDGDGKIDLAGDFDGDGTVDVGGTNVPYYASGDSFGGIMAMIQGGTDPFIAAAAPISGGGGLTDIATRSSLVPDSVLEQIFSPLVVAVPAEERAPDAQGPTTQCSAGERSVRLVVNDLIDSAEIEVACLTQAELDAGKTVVVTNLASKERRCARTAENGRFRLPIPASVGDKLDIQIFDAPDVVDSYKTCNIHGLPPAGRRVHTWEQPATRFRLIAEGAQGCPDDAPSGCQQFQASFFEVGDDLRAPQEGLGYARQTPDFRKLMDLVQAAVDPSDPVNFAAYYVLRPVPGIDGSPAPPRAVLDIHDIGDPFVPTGAGNTFSRAAGLLPFLPSSAAALYPEYADFATPPALEQALGGKTPNEVLIERHVLEGQARFARTPAGAGCAANYVPSATCTDSAKADPATCDQSLFDVDWLSEGAQRFDQQHLAPPLRLARRIDARGADAWAPRTSVPFQPPDDASGWQPGAPLGALVNAYMSPLGQHVWFIADPCKAWDDVMYMERLVARFLGSGGKDVYFASHPATHECLAHRTCDFDQP